MNHRKTQKPPRYRVVMDKTKGNWDIQFGTTSNGRFEDLETYRVQEMFEGLELALAKVRHFLFMRMKSEQLTK